MTTKFIHTADWQLGKPFASVPDSQKRAILQNERLCALERIASVARSHAAEFIVVAGDIFDSPNALKTTIAAAFSAISAMKVPVFVIPGNHDHGGPGSLWEDPFFVREQPKLAPNLKVLLTAEPVETETAVLFPCPLMRRHEATDTTTWLASACQNLEQYGNKPRIVLAHGTVQSFGSQVDDEEAGEVANHIDLGRLPQGELDYIALGDWHGTKQVGAKAWYSGTPELDRFIKGEDHQPGNVLAVTASRGAAPVVVPERTARINWHELSFMFSDDLSLKQLEEQIVGILEGRAQQDLLFLRLTGSLGITATTKLEEHLETLEARLLRLKLSNNTHISPSEEEIIALTQRVGDPLISRVAARLVTESAGNDESAAIARTALRELHALCTRN